jgi:hypothetical protein
MNKTTKEICRKGVFLPYYQTACPSAQLGAHQAFKNFRSQKSLLAVATPLISVR